MVGELFAERINNLLGCNEAVETLVVRGSRAAIVADSRAGIEAKDDILILPLLNGYESVFYGSQNGWEKYSVLRNGTEIDPDEEELRNHLTDYRQEASTSSGYTPSFGELLEEEPARGTPKFGEWLQKQS